MKVSLLVLLVMFSTLSFATSPHPDVVYGEDNRSEPFEKPLLAEHSKSVAAMVSNKFLFNETETQFKINLPSQQDEYGLCLGEKFNDQPVLADCTGFLVAPDVIMTAGHCVETMEDCEGSQWVFGFEMSKSKKAPKTLAKNNVYSCTGIIARSYGFTKVDYAIIKLDRPTDRAPLELIPENTSAKVGDKIFMMGYPSGLPLKITDGATVQKIEPIGLVTNLDAFHVNSGSPVFDEKTGLVVGILVSGMPDYAPSSRGCDETSVLSELHGKEKVTSLGAVPRKF